MTQSTSPDINLAGLRLGLSGAVPEQTEWEGRVLDWEILNFVSALSDNVFRYGGHLVHGSHPSFTPRILRQAEAYQRVRDEPFITFVMSALWAQGRLARQLGQQRYASILELVLVDKVVPPEAERDDASDSMVRNASLEAMRRRLVAEMDALVIIGGKRWRNSDNKPGTLQELELALERKIPCFLLGGFGGMAGQLASRPEYQSRLGNGLAPRDNEYLLRTSNFGGAVALIVDCLDRAR